MPNSGGSRKPSVRKDATSPVNVGVEGSSCSVPATVHRRKRKKVARVKAGAQAPPRPVRVPVRVGSSVTPKDGGIRKGGNGSASGSGAKSARVPPSLSIADCQVKKSSLSRKTAGASVIAPIGRSGKAEASGSRKVKFSTNVHTYPAADKKTRIGELHLKKPIKKLKRNRPLSSGGGKSVASKLELSIAQKSGSVLRRDVQHSGAAIDVEPVATARGRKAPSPLATKASVASKASVAGAARKVKRLTKSRIKAGTSNRQPVVTAIRPCPRLAYSIQPDIKRDILLLKSAPKK
ncbi:uncharacterized protein LOC115564027 isoform X2 [Drosophila navojoa]|uniref:uncharacterized protein LOC115564027 isoform X2 n=1 Tax=Drosophila navojoa TaxID=7232 RepID=UPI0011BE8F17|nr:uncharacterized protein LOC115564027 isoform X2 [Drosophila navojoa]